MPAWLDRAAAVGWRLLVVAAALLAVLVVLSKVRVVVVPAIAVLAGIVAVLAPIVAHDGSSLRSSTNGGIDRGRDRRDVRLLPAGGRAPEGEHRVAAG